MNLKCKDWLNTYIEYTKHSEAPERFHYWTGISVIASTLGRKVWWNLGYGGGIFPNLYVILVAKSAGLKKTAATEIGVDLLYLLPESSKIEIVADKLTNEYILAHLGRLSSAGADAVAFVYAEELSVFIGPNALSSGLIASLTKLYNCPKYFPYKTKTAGTFLLTNCCLNMLGASTPEWLNLVMPSEALGGGFAGRMMFITGIEKERSIAHPLRVMPPREEVSKIRRELITDLGEMGKLGGEFVMTDEAEEWYDGWYEEREKEHSTDQRLVSYNERRHITLVKVAMVLAVARGKEYVIERMDLEESLKEIRKIEEDLLGAYEGITFSTSTKDMDRIGRQIAKAGRISKSALLKKNWGRLTADDLKPVISTLKQMEVIDEVVEGKKTFYVARKGGET